MRHAIALFTQQLSIKLRSLGVWILIWCVLLLFFTTVFNSLSKDAADTAKVFQQLPKEVFTAININPAAYLTSIENFLSGQFLFVYLLAGSIFSFSLGVGAIGRRIENGTIAGILTKPIPRTVVYLMQAKVTMLFLLLAGSLIGTFAWTIFNALLTNQDSISGRYFFGLFLGSTLLFMTFSALGQLLGMMLNGGRSLAVGAGLIVASWFINSLGELANLPTWLQYASVFHYFDVPMLRDDFALNGARTACLILLLIAVTIIGSRLFKKKDIYI